jgi:hypothetical protein
MGLQGKHVTKAVGISQVLLSQWIGRGHVVPDTPAEGPGTRNEFKKATICQIYLFKELSDAKFSRAEASRLAFDKKVKHFFQKTITSEEVLNALHPDYVGPQPVFNVAFIRKGKNIEVKYITSEEEYMDLYDRIIRSKQVLIKNLTWIALYVLGKV